MPMTDFLEAKILNMVLNSIPYVEPDDMWIGLFTVSPSDTGGGTEVPTGGGTLYGRVQVTADFSTDDLDTRFSNDSSIDFPTAGIDWNTIVAVGFFDLATAGDLLLYEDLAVTRNVDAGDTFSFVADALGVTLD